MQESPPYFHLPTTPTSVTHKLGYISANLVNIDQKKIRFYNINFPILTYLANYKQEREVCFSSNLRPIFQTLNVDSSHHVFKPLCVSA